MASLAGQYGGMRPATPNVKELEAENVRLKKLVRQQTLDIDITKGGFGESF